MNPTNKSRKLDSLGRLVIPASLRKDYGNSQAALRTPSRARQSPRPPRQEQFQAIVGNRLPNV